MSKERTEGVINPHNNPSLNNPKALSHLRFIYLPAEKYI